MIDFHSFIAQHKSMLIAPAGYGKTHAISECLQHTPDKQLILTHTNAGVASIKEKLKKNNIPSSRYNVETITSFAQKYVLAFYQGTDLPEQSDSSRYYPFIISKAILLFERVPIQNILLATYKGIFVDEYQDCTLSQHQLVIAISKNLPTRILGDPLQGIFGFNGESLVNMNDSTSMLEFLTSRYELTEPQRWLNGNNEQLGTDLQKLREQLILNNSIDLGHYTAIDICVIDEKDLYNLQKEYNKKIYGLLKEKNILLLHPDSFSMNRRLDFVKRFSNKFKLIEAIDDNGFYKLSKVLDTIVPENRIGKIKEVCYGLFNKTGVDNWFGNNKLKNKSNQADKLLIEPITVLFDKLSLSISLTTISNILQAIKGLPDLKCYRLEIFNSLIEALNIASEMNITIEQAMVIKRNNVRRSGRKIYGRCIGTTLLTKGLEFDTVAILNAHDFKCPKHFYVACTRASKRLIIFTNKKILNPYPLK